MQVVVSTFYTIVTKQNHILFYEPNPEICLDIKNTRPGTKS